MEALVTEARNDCKENIDGFGEAKPCCSKLGSSESQCKQTGIQQEQKQKQNDKISHADNVLLLPTNNEKELYNVSESLIAKDKVLLGSKGTPYNAKYHQLLSLDSRQLSTQQRDAEPHKARGGKVRFRANIVEVEHVTCWTNEHRSALTINCHLPIYVRIEGPPALLIPL